MEEREPGLRREQSEGKHEGEAICTAARTTYEFPLPGSSEHSRLFERLRAACRSLAKQVLRDEHVAEDVAQIAMLKTACKGGADPAAFRYESAVFSYALTIARNAAIRESKRRTRQQPMADGFTPEESINDSQVESNMKYLLCELRRCLKLLPDKERTIIERCYLGGRTLKQVGEEFGHSTTWAHDARQRALRALQKLFMATTDPDLYVIERQSLFESIEASKNDEAKGRIP